MDTEFVLFSWLAFSIGILLLSQLYLWQVLRARGVPLAHFYIGTPGYLDWKYILWCEGNNVSYRPLIFVRIALSCSVVLTVLALQIFTPDRSGGCDCSPAQHAIR